jgi:hypothetical protein
MKRQSLNPLLWFRQTQDWFTRTERSSGFRPYLIFLLILFSLGFILLYVFGGNEKVVTFVINSLYVGVGGFVLFFGVKMLQQPDFCRSEKHVENLTRLTAAEQKGDRGPMFFAPENVHPIQNVHIPLSASTSSELKLIPISDKSPRETQP